MDFACIKNPFSSYPYRIQYFCFCIAISLLWFWFCCYCCWCPLQLILLLYYSASIVTLRVHRWFLYRKKFVQLFYRSINQVNPVLGGNRNPINGSDMTNPKKMYWTVKYDLEKSSISLFQLSWKRSIIALLWKIIV